MAKPKHKSRRRSRRNGRNGHNGPTTPLRIQPYQPVAPDEVEQIGRFISEAFNLTVEDDPDERDWKTSSQRIERDRGNALSPTDRVDSFEKVRWLERNQPNVKQAMRLYMSYVLGQGFGVQLKPRDSSVPKTDKEKNAIVSTDLAWFEFLQFNKKWWTPREFGKRVWRDGEQFTKKVVDEETSWPPRVQFIDPEEIDDPQAYDRTGQPKTDYSQHNDGIETEEDDVTQVKAYYQVDVTDRHLIAELGPDDVWHTKIDVDSTEKRGVTRFFSTIWHARQIPAFLDTEYKHRKLQASIVLHETVDGSPTRVTNHLDNTKTSTTTFSEGDRRREKIRPGSKLTTNKSVGIEFKQPQSNFTDASPLLKALIEQIAAATGWAYFMVAATSSDSNFAAALVQESPVVMMIQDERDFFRDEFYDIYVWLLEMALQAGKIEGYVSIDRLLEDFEVDFTWPPLVTRDRLKETQADNILNMNNSLSRQEMSRRAGLDPHQMAQEIKEDAEDDVLGNMVGVMGSMNQTQAQKSANQADNQGDGQNQGDNEPISHDDRI